MHAQGVFVFHLQVNNSTTLSESRSKLPKPDELRNRDALLSSPPTLAVAEACPDARRCRDAVNTLPSSRPTTRHEDCCQEATTATRAEGRRRTSPCRSC
uniref:Uncharacterized protein n=1 Tax=Arundo donax TaxID=35708 RepID=A0A0A9DJE3_ARUDO